VPLRRYRIWNRMGAAVRACGEGSSLTEAAHAAGFASSAHFSSAFRDMFGMMPSDLLKALRPVAGQGQAPGGGVGPAEVQSKRGQAGEAGFTAD
jgi:AraC-like DNA-binding protein